MSCVLAHRRESLKNMHEVQKYTQNKQLSADALWKKQWSFTKPKTFSVMKHEAHENIRSQMYTWPGSNWRPSACEADVIATRPQVLLLETPTLQYCLSHLECLLA